MSETWEEGPVKSQRSNYASWILKEKSEYVSGSQEHIYQKKTSICIVSEVFINLNSIGQADRIILRLKSQLQ